MAEPDDRPDEAGETPAPAPAPPAAQPGPAPAVEAPKRTAAFRKGLLAKLPQLGYSAWAVKDSFKLDDEWNAIVNVKADAVLEPLEPLAPTRT